MNNRCYSDYFLAENKQKNGTSSQNEKITQTPTLKGIKTQQNQVFHFSLLCYFKKSIFLNNEKSVNTHIKNDLHALYSLP